MSKSYQDNRNNFFVPLRGSLFLLFPILFLNFIYEPFDNTVIAFVPTVNSNQKDSQPSNQTDVVAANGYKFVKSLGSKDADGGEFDQPVDVSVDSSGNAYVVDKQNYRIQKFDSSGKFITMWGSLGVGDGQFDFDEYSKLTTDSSGNVYVADSNNDSVQKFDSSGNFIKKWGTYGEGNGKFELPTGIAADSSGNVYVADMYDDSVQKFDSSGNFKKNGDFSPVIRVGSFINQHG